MGEYQAEQAALTGTLAAIQSQLAEKADYAEQLEKLQQAFSDYLDIGELTPLVLNKLIDRIEIGSQEVVDGQRQQEIRIVWRFWGMRINPSKQLTLLHLFELELVEQHRPHLMIEYR